MPHKKAGFSFIAAFAAAAFLLLPAAASAWTVTVHVHGAGTVSEVTNRVGGNQNQMNCTVGPSGKSNTSVTDCVGGSASGLYNSGNIVRLSPSVSTDAAFRGWHFSHWTDSTASGQINCDPQDTTGDFSSPVYCEFQIFQNLETTLYFDDTTGPQDTSISGGPAQGVTTSSTTASFTFNAASDPDSTFQCRLDPPGGVGSFLNCPTHATFNNLTANGTWMLTVRAVDPSGNVDTSPATRSWVVDTTPPNLTLTGGPAQDTTTNSTGATFTIGSSDGTLTCTIDGSSSSCSNGAHALSGLGDGSHTFSLTGTDAVGNTSTKSRTWTVDATPPTVTLSGGPAQGSSTNSTGATFTIGTNEGTLGCTLDGNPVSCSPPTKALSSLSEGSHTFAVSATDAAGNTSTSSRTWTVDTTPPTVTLAGGPAQSSTTNSTGATFTIGTNEGTLSCTLDGSAVACSAPTKSLASLTEGSHTFTISATDTAGNGSAASRTWTVDLTAPDTALAGGPAEGSTTPAATATFSFTSADSSATFECKLDDAAFAACTSPLALHDLGNGGHTLQVRAVDPAGNTDGSPATRTWTVNTLDGDSDGYNRPQDCDDTNAGIHPGASDAPGDGIDQDCSGVDATAGTSGTSGNTPGSGGNNGGSGGGDVGTGGTGGGPVDLVPVSAAIAHRFSVKGSKTTVKVLKLSKLPADAKVTVTCKGRKCPVKSKTKSPSAAGVVDVRSLLKKKPLTAGSTLTIRVVEPGHVTKVATFVIRRGKQPKGGGFGCLPAGAKTPRLCA